LRARILMMIGFAILASTVLMGMRFYQNRTSEIAAALTELSTAAADVASDLDGKIQGTAQLLHGLARARDLDSRDRTACSSFLADLRDEYPQYTGLLTIDPDGRLFCDSIGGGRDLDLSDRAYFKKALISKEAVVLEPVVGRLTGNPVLQIAHAVRSEIGPPKQVLLASLNLKTFAEYHSRRLLRGSVILLVDKNGTVLTQTSASSWFNLAGTSIADTDLFKQPVAHGSPWVGEIAGVDGGMQVWGVASSPVHRDAGIYFMVGRSRDDLVATANRRFLGDLAIHSVISILLFAGVLSLADIRVRRQIRRLSLLATKLGLGDLGARIAPPYPVGALGDLMTQMNGTAESLERQRASIDDLNGKLLQAQKMEALGQLTGGLAHDFNNLLTVVLGNSELLIEQLADRDDLRSMAELSLVACRRGADLTRSLLAFARNQPLEPKVVDVNDLVSGMESLMRRTLGGHIEMAFVRGDDLWLALVDPPQLENAVLNLCINARDAMEDGGRLSIETINALLDDDAVDADLAPGEYVMIAVSDTGKGISPENLARVFDPFFTTKDVGKGTGLGLSMVHGFISQSRGQIRIYSEIGQGTVIKMFLPRSGNAHCFADEINIAMSDVGGTENILLVEDDELVRQHTERQLVSLGYHVITAVDGPTALAVVMAGGDFDLLFTDVVMPNGMNGRMLATQLVKIRPHLRVLFASGYTENLLVHEGRLAEDTLLLSKPYSRTELARKIRMALASSPVESV
jgi:signal transduction histidine kinase